MSNALNRDIKPGEQLVVDKQYLYSENEPVEKRIFIARGGFGCMVTAVGRKIFGFFKDEGINCHIYGGQINVEETEAWQVANAPLSDEEQEKLFLSLQVG